MNMNEDTVEVIEIWMPVEKGGEAYYFKNRQNLKLVAFLVGGHPVKLEDQFVMERRNISKEEAKHIRLTNAG